MTSTYPRTLAMALARLRLFPLVRMECDDPELTVAHPSANPMRFIRADVGAEEETLWFLTADGAEAFLPIKQGPERYQTFLSFAVDHFDVFRGGKRIRVHYLPNQALATPADVRRHQVMRKWHVRVFGRDLGVIEAPTLRVAVMRARQTFPGVATLPRGDFEVWEIHPEQEGKTCS